MGGGGGGGGGVGRGKKGESEGGGERGQAIGTWVTAKSAKTRI